MKEGFEMELPRSLLKQFVSLRHFVVWEIEYVIYSRVSQTMGRDPKWGRLK